MLSPIVEARVNRWLSRLEARHLADLRVSEVTRALRALSSAYVERRQVMARGGALDGGGKRAAFALYYGPIHLLTTIAVVKALTADQPPPATIIDVGCGTGVAGAAWALCAGRSSSIDGIDRHPWAVEEARWTYQQFNLHGHARHGDAQRLPRIRSGDAIVAAYVLNELPDTARRAVLERLLASAASGARVLIVEPISRAVAPWWDRAALRFAAAGGRSDEWRFALERPAIVALLDKAAGLDHREVKVRTLYAAGAER